MKNVSLAIIAKDEDKQLIDIIGKYNHYFDFIYIAYEGVPEQLEGRIMMEYEYDVSSRVKIYPYSWVYNFSDKRNFIASKVEEDYYVRMDTDDELVGLDNLEYMIGQMNKTNTDIVMCLYDYNKSEGGNTELAHYRETVIRNCSKIYWKGSVHESLVADNNDSIVFYRDTQQLLKVIHHIDSRHKASSMIRNIEILRNEYNNDGDKTDPRTLAYLGRSLFDVGETEEALPILEEHLRQCGWDEDKYITLLYLAECGIKLNIIDDFFKYIFKAIEERPDYPASYARLCEYYYKIGNYAKAFQHGITTILRPAPETNMCFDPSLTTWKVPLYMALCSVGLNKYKDAFRFFKIAKEKGGTEEDVVNLIPMFESLKHDVDYMENLRSVINFTQERDESKVIDIVRSIPQSMDGNQMIADLKNKYLPNKVHSDKSIVIYCGETPHMWSPKSTETGIGGSEEATINISSEFVKMGYEVTVYLTCEDDCEHEGVKYIHYNKFNRFDEFNILVGWRQNLARHSITARNHIYWIHDMPSANMLTVEALEKLDTVIVLSEYHKSLLPKHVSDNCKVIISTNGLNVEDFNGLETISKTPKSIIYASSYDRGLETILKNWKTIRAEVPEATLNVYYGWNIYDSYTTKGINDGSFKLEMLPLLNQPGVTDHGRIGHKELLQEYSKASVYAYPCSYVPEINCIALTKAIAANCNIVTNDFAVMAERSPNSVTQEEFINGVITELKKDPQSGLNSKYIASMSWANVALQWKEEVFNG